MKGLRAILSGTGLISGTGGIVALTAFNKAPTASVLEIIEEEPPVQVEEKKEEVIVEETGSIMDVYVVGYNRVDGSRRPLVNEISPDKLTDAFIALDGEIKNCSLSGNEHGRSYVYWHPIQKQFVCRKEFQWKDWFTAGGVKKVESLNEVKLSDNMERVKNLRVAMTTFAEERHDMETFKNGCKAVYDLTFEDKLGMNFCTSLLNLSYFDDEE